MRRKGRRLVMVGIGMMALGMVVPVGARPRTIRHNGMKVNYLKDVLPETKKEWNGNF